MKKEGVVYMQVRANRGRYELRFALKNAEKYVGSYTSHAQAESNGRGMLERGEARELFTRRKS